MICRKILFTLIFISIKNPSSSQMSLEGYCCCSSRTKSFFCLLAALSSTAWFTIDKLNKDYISDLIYASDIIHNLQLTGFCNNGNESNYTEVTLKDSIIYYSLTDFLSDNQAGMFTVFLALLLFTISSFFTSVIHSNCGSQRVRFLYFFIQTLVWTMVVYATFISTLWVSSDSTLDINESFYLHNVTYSSENLSMIIELNTSSLFYNLSDQNPLYPFPTGYTYPISSLTNAFIEAISYSPLLVSNILNYTIINNSLECNYNVSIGNSTVVSNLPSSVDETVSNIKWQLTIPYLLLSCTFIISLLLYIQDVVKLYVASISFHR